MKRILFCALGLMLFVFSNFTLKAQTHSEREYLLIQSKNGREGLLDSRNQLAKMEGVLARCFFFENNQMAIAVEKPLAPEFLNALNAYAQVGVISPEQFQEFSYESVIVKLSYWTEADLTSSMFRDAKFPFQNPENMTAEARKNYQEQIRQWAKNNAELFARFFN